MAGDHFHCTVESPLGALLLTSNGEALTGLYMNEQRHRPVLPADSECAPRGGAQRVFDRAREQLTAYFSGTLTQFEVPLAFEGTPFQQTVWKALLDIPFGETESYGALARRVGREGAARAVGLANGHNPIGIIVPCHRVIGANGSLTGYGGGIERKRWLLGHESAQALTMCAYVESR